MIEEGKALAEQLRAQVPTEDSEFTGTLEIRDGQGKRTRVPVRLQTRVRETEWHAAYETAPTQSLAGEKFVVIHSFGKPNRYLHSRQVNADDNSKFSEISAEQAMVPLAGSDFWLADLGLDFFHWPYQRLVRRELRRGRSCRVLESINPDAKPPAYSRVLSWIDVETDGLIRAEAYDENSKLLKEFSVGSFKKIKGHWELQDFEIRNEQTDSRTRLEFDLKPK
jgi:Outer membrane lipoprotein-sorting protein